MGLASPAAHLSVLLRERRSSAASRRGSTLLRRHGRASCGPGGFPLCRPGALSFARCGLPRLSLRRCLATTLGLFPVHTLVTRAVCRRRDLRRAFVSSVASATLARELPVRRSLGGFLREAAAARCRISSEALACATTSGITRHAPSGVRLHATHEGRPMSFVSSHSLPFHQPLGSLHPFIATECEACCAGTVDRGDRRHAHGIRAVARLLRTLRHAVRPDVGAPNRECPSV